MKLIVCEIAKHIKEYNRTGSQDILELITDLKLKAYCELLRVNQNEVFKRLGVI